MPRTLGGMKGSHFPRCLDEWNRFWRGPNICSGGVSIVASVGKDQIQTLNSWFSMAEKEEDDDMICWDGSCCLQGPMRHPLRA